MKLDQYNYPTPEAQGNVHINFLRTQANNLKVRAGNLVENNLFVSIAAGLTAVTDVAIVGGGVLAAVTGGVPMLPILSLAAIITTPIAAGIGVYALAKGAAGLIRNR